MSVDVCRQVFHIDSRFSSLSFLLNGTSLWKKKDAQQCEMQISLVLAIRCVVVPPVNLHKVCVSS